ncbi:MAG: DNA-binding protein [Alphaproteobacteria bacterium]|nr:MAG: DNA-binding protein [Alphaproteobacteria bacterium]
MDPNAPSALPASSFTEDAHITTSKGAKVSRWGSVKQACKILDECDVKTIYALKKSGDIRAYKRRPDRPNSHLRVDLVSVWEHKQKQLGK